MIVASSLHYYHLSLWHLINHAYFKALLFLSAGVIIHALYDNQDLRKFGSLILYIPHLYNLFLIGNLSLIAFPFLTGFYSKDLIIELSLSHNMTLIFFIIFITAIISSLYSIRLFILTFYSKPNFNYNIHLDSSLSPIFLFTISILSLGAIFFGYITHTMSYSSYLSHIFIHPQFNNFLDNLIFHNILSLLPLFFFFYFIFPNSSFIWKGNINILQQFNIYYHYFIFYYLSFSNIILRYWDRGFIELFTPYGLISLFNYLSFRFELFNSSYLLHYFLILLFSLFFFILF
jgi:NADH-ubiquinone oxidoreductase chain 5